MSAIQVGKLAPEFSLLSVSGLDPTPCMVKRGDYAGRWLMLIFYPRDFSFVCPTELTAFSARLDDFEERDCDFLGISVDTIELHQEWLKTPPAEGGLGPLRFPLASDPDGEVAREYGVWVEEKEVSTRGLFIIDPDGVLQYSVVHNLSVGRSPDEVLRVLDALRTGGLCPVSWTLADGTIDPEGALQPGRILGHYRIRRHLGDGTFGSVFAAWDLRLERMVALKVLKRNVFESREAALSEARVAARVNDPNICTIYAVEEEDGLPVIAMEYLHGHSMWRMLREHQEEVSMQIVSQVANGLASAHRLGVVHGDLKPGNIMVTTEGTAKILDFGLARSQVTAPPSDESVEIGLSESTGADPEETVGLNDHAASVSDAATAIRGTPAYMSPEQAKGRPMTAASDVFSFGLILFEVLTGSRALTGPTVVDLLLKLEKQGLREELVAQVEEPYREILAAMLSHSPKDRPSMSEVAQRLEASHIL